MMQNRRMSRMNAKRQTGGKKICHVWLEREVRYPDGEENKKREEKEKRTDNKR